MNLKVEEYLRDDGSNPYKKWFDALVPLHRDFDGFEIVDLFVWLGERRPLS